MILRSVVHPCMTTPRSIGTHPSCSIRPTMHTTANSRGSRSSLCAFRNHRDPAQHACSWQIPRSHTAHNIERNVAGWYVLSVSNLNHAARATSAHPSTCHHTRTHTFSEDRGRPVSAKMGYNGSTALGSNCCVREPADGIPPHCI